jgi:hypothetical protein
MYDDSDSHDHFIEIGDNVGYDDALREFFIVVDRHGDELVQRQAISYCPVCGAKFPKSLREDWYRKLSAIGVDPLNDEIPFPYSDGSWWKSV